MTTLTPLAIQAISESFLSMTEAAVIQKNLNLKLFRSSEDNETLEIDFSIVADKMPKYIHDKFFNGTKEKSSLVGVLNLKATYNKCSFNKGVWDISESEAYITALESSGCFLELVKLTETGNDSHKSEEATSVELSKQQQLSIVRAYLFDLKKDGVASLAQAVMKKNNEQSITGHEFHEVLSDKAC